MTVSAGGGGGGSATTTVLACGAYAPEVAPMEPGVLIMKSMTRLLTPASRKSMMSAALR